MTKVAAKQSANPKTKALGVRLHAQAVPGVA